MRSTTKSKQDAHTETDLEGETKKPPALYLQKTNKQRKSIQLLKSMDIPGKLDRGPRQVAF